MKNKGLTLGDAAVLLNAALGYVNWLGDIDLPAALGHHDSPSHDRSSSARGAGKAAVEILRKEARPMHAANEILPELRARGINVTRAALVKTLRRIGVVRRVAAGTYEIVQGNDAPVTPSRQGGG